MAFLMLLGLTACASSDATAPVPQASADVQGWQTAAGKAPTKAEFTAVVAACQDRAGAGPLDPCLADLGLRKLR